MSTITQTNVLKLDSKEGQSSKVVSTKKLKINYSRDKNLTDFGNQHLSIGIFCLAKNFKICSCVLQEISQMMMIMPKNIRLYFKTLVYASNSSFIKWRRI